ncbi:unnamed protein product [[Candida] boidinii]|nr:hypothetical protein BVG19_g5037 [[Candida] boidinii]OWB48606.1 hypothetical protein B5S27_g141 [[Candida] boidinii]GMF26146.1 unnamed protein product [[Candida] boidinii]
MNSQSYISNQNCEHLISINEVFKLLEPYGNISLLSAKDSNTIIFKLIELLMENSCDSTTLKYLSRFLTPDSYEDLVTERIINHYCGYPLCSYYSKSNINLPSKKTLADKFKILRSYSSKFCSKKHYQCSEFYKRQLNKDALWIRNNIFQLPLNYENSYESKLILLDDVFEDKENNKNQNEKIDEIINLLRSMKVDESSNINNATTISSNNNTANTNTNTLINTIINTTNKKDKFKPDFDTDELISEFQNIKIIENSGMQKSDEIYGGI